MIADIPTMNPIIRIDTTIGGATLSVAVGDNLAMKSVRLIKDR